jgi:hypothetical protein
MLKALLELALKGFVRELESHPRGIEIRICSRDPLTQQWSRRQIVSISPEQVRKSLSGPADARLLEIELGTSKIVLKIKGTGA